MRDEWEQEIDEIMGKIMQMDDDGVQMIAEALADILRDGVVPAYSCNSAS